MPLKTLVDEQPTMNLTSMIDVLFLLIIFFMLATKFSDQERSIDVQVPQVGKAAALSDPPDRKTINLYRDGRLSLEGQFLTLDELAVRLSNAQANYPDLGVTLRGDADGRFQHIADVLAACRRAGVADLAIAVRNEEAGATARKGQGVQSR
jgi:biopolymer transport protein ExbD